MLSGVKFIPRDKVDDERDGSKGYQKQRKGGREKKHKRKKKVAPYSSSDDEVLDRINKGSRKKKKWYSSDENSSSYSTESEDSGSSDMKDNKHRKRKQDGDGGPQSDQEIVRKEIGLEWMIKPGERIDRRNSEAVDIRQEEAASEEIKKVNPKELNPYLKDNGSGYPEDSNRNDAGGDQLPPSAVVGDGGASWRLKALKRAQEQAGREGRKLEEVVEERWGSLGHLAVSVASSAAAPSRAHLHAIKNRKRGQNEEHGAVSEKKNEMDSEKETRRDYLKDVSSRHPEMREPRVQSSLSWGKRKSQSLPSKDAGLVSSAVSKINKFANDGSFMQEVLNRQSNLSDDPAEGSAELNSVSCSTDKDDGSSSAVKETLTANQLAAKAFQLKMKGKHEEAQKLLQEVEDIKAAQDAGEKPSRLQNEGRRSRYDLQDASLRQKRKEDDSDMHLAQRIMRNKQYSISGQADDEYDFEDGPNQKSRKKKGGGNHKDAQKNPLLQRIKTQEERCMFCFANPSRPKHLVVAIANFTYLMLPQLQAVVPGHCCILPMQHEASTRSLDKNVWEEMRNFKKCLIMMFAKQEKDVIFLETVMGLAKQRRHCLIDCIPLPREVAKEAPIYFKKAIDEAEDEWSQHNAKKLIDTSEKGLRGSIPEHFPYFHVEFGLNRGFVHVIDDETQFKSSFGLNVVRGMLRLPEEDMHRRRRSESVEAQKQAVVSFAEQWKHFDWTKAL